MVGLPAFDVCNLYASQLCVLDSSALDVLYYRADTRQTLWVAYA